MKKVYYEKVGRKYVPVKEYDSDFLSAFPKSTHLVMSYPGGQSTRYNIDPNDAAMIAAGRVAEDAICSAMVKASELKPQRTPLTKEQLRAWLSMPSRTAPTQRHLQLKLQQKGPGTSPKSLLRWHAAGRTCV